MQDSDIAESDQPFGSLPECGEIQAVDDPSHPISPACAKNGIHGVIIEHALQIRSALLIGPGKISIAGTQGLPLDHPESPFIAQYLETCPHPAFGHVPCRTDHTDGIPFAQGWWDDDISYPPDCC